MTTPMMMQWASCKEKAKGALLLFRLGDFYEAFHEDAEVLSKELSLTLTARQGIPMCGVPFHTADGYLDKLVAKGFKVAIAEQTEDPKDAKGLVKREIARIVSPGTIVQSQLLVEKKNNYFAALNQIGEVFAIAAIDVTTGEFRTIEIDTKNDLLDELYRIRPAEILVSSNFKNTHGPLLKDLSLALTFALAVEDAWRFCPKQSLELMLSHFKIESLDHFGLKGKLAAIGASGALLGYLTQERAILLDHITSISSELSEKYMGLDRSTLRNLEILDLLLPLIDKTDTPMGGRLLAQWITHPLLSVKEIQKRQEAIEELLSFECPFLKQIRDIERLCMKVVSKQASARDLYSLGHSLSKLPQIQEALSPFQSPLLNFLKNDLIDPISLEILNALCDHPPLRVGEGDTFKDGYNKDLDHLRSLTKNSLGWMNEYQNKLREETGIKTLKVGFTRAFGYYIESTRAQSEKIPPTFHRRQTLVNTERWITEELKNFEHQVLSAEERIKALEQELFENLRSKIASFSEQMKKAAAAVALLDVLLSLAKVASQLNWIKPTVDESDQIEIIGGRHPVVENAIGKNSFIPNDLFLSPKQQLLLITGPNMAGKSTFIRQVALLVLLAQIGSFIPADSAKIGIVDKIFSRIGASDDLARGQSTFMVEMAETANILKNSGPRSLVLLDEIGRGTSTYDGISIAWAVAETLLTTSKAKTLFATHYWELTRLPSEIQHAANFQVAIQETNDGIVFLRKIVPGATDKSYGIHVAKLAGLPQFTIRRAQEILQKLEQSQIKPKKKASVEKQLELFS